MINNRLSNIFHKLPIDFLFLEPDKRRLQDQSEKFFRKGLRRDAAVKTLDRVLQKNFGKIYNEDIGMFSEHLVLLAGLSNLYKPKKILEIGTYDGKTALILSDLFPQAEITSIDLPAEEKEFSSTYSRGLLMEDFLDRRDQLLSRSSRINFLEMNSIGLTRFENETYDLVWIDGDHGYPMVSFDFINSVRISKRGGIILIDDIWKKIKVEETVYRSIGGYASLKAAEKAKIVSDVELFYKRLAHNYNTQYNQKHIGFCKIV